MPGFIVEVIGIHQREVVSGVKGRCGSRAAGELPFGFTGQAIAFARFVRKPFTKLGSLVPTYMNHGQVFVLPGSMVWLESTVFADSHGERANCEFPHSDLHRRQLGMIGEFILSTGAHFEFA